MLIQCQSCATRYRVDLERLPRRKTFIRCKNCGTPIYLDPDLEGGDALPPGAAFPAGAVFVPGAAAQFAAGESGAGLVSHEPGATGPALPPQEPEGMGGEEAPHPHEGVPVQCPQCQSRYRVPATALQRPNIKLKCSVCSHIFAPAAAETAGGERDVDTLFDDLRAPPGPGPAGARLTDSAVNRLQGAPGGGPFPEPEELDPELAYLDAVALDEDETPGPTVGKVPEAQKYQLFLKPDQFRAGAAPAAPPAPPPAEPPPFDGMAAKPARTGAAPSVEAERFDGEEMPSFAAPAEPELPAPPAAVAPAAKPQGPVAPLPSVAATADEWELPPLDEEPEAGPEPSEAELAEVMDLELPPPSALTGAGKPAGATEFGGTGLDLNLDELPPLEEPAAAADLAAGLESADLPTMDDVELDLDDLEADAAQAVRSAEEASPELPPLEPREAPSPALDLESLDSLPPLPDFEPPPPGPAPAALHAIVPVPSGAKGAGPSGAKGAGPGREGKEPPGRIVVPGQEGWFTDRRRVYALMAVAGLILGGILAWGGWMMRGDRERPFAFEFGRVHQLALQEDLTGRAVTGRGGHTLFVVEGRLVNRFPAGVRIGWIRVRGTVYADHAQTRTLGTAQAYLGNVLGDAQLQTMAPDAIAAYGAYTNGRKDVNFDIPSGAAVPFQLVFPDVTAPVARGVVQVIGYTRNGLAVYLDAQVNGGR